jgi:hypothetical protein
MLTYGDVELITPTPEHEEWVAYALGPEADAAWPGYEGRRGVPLRDPTDRAALGTLSWPRSASLWAVGQYLVDSDRLALIRQAAFRRGGYRALPLALGDGDNTVTTSLWMLPARPLAAMPGQPGLHLLTLVDDRYFWRRRAASVAAAGGSTTWEALVASLGAALGVAVALDPVPAAYLLPDPSLAAVYGDLPALLDRVATAVGMRVVRTLDGAVKVQSYASALAQTRANLRRGLPAQAGGEYALLPGQPELSAALPASVTVVYPAGGDGAPAALEAAYTVLLSDLGLAEVGASRGGPGTAVLRSSALAHYAGGGAPANDAELAALARQMATDWYRWRTARGAWAFAGVAPWVPEALGESVVWEYRQGEVRTLLHRTPEHGGCCRCPGDVGEPDSPVWGTYGSLTLRTAQDTSPVETLSTSTVATFAAPPYSTVILTSTASGGTTITDLQVTNTQTLTRFVVTGSNPVTVTNIVVVDGSGSPLTTRAVNLTMTPGGSTSSFSVLVAPDNTAYLVDVTGTQSVSLTLSTSTNNWAPGPANTVNLTTTSNLNVTGIDVTSANSTFTIFNIPNYTYPYNLTITNEDSSSTAANRVHTTNGLNIIVPPGGQVTLTYDTTTQRWTNTTLPGGPFTVRSNLTYTQFQTASSSTTVNVYTLPPGTFLTNVILVVDANYSDGTVFTNYKLDLGVTGTQDYFIHQLNVKLAPLAQQELGGTAQGGTGGNPPWGLGGGTNVTATITASSGLLTALTAGAFHVYAIFNLLP